MLIRQYTIAVLTLLTIFSHVTLASDLKGEPGNKLGQTIATQGNGKGAAPCISCHGSDGGGQAQAGFPRLAGLNQTYIEKQLHDFTTINRNNPVMSPVAKSLSVDEIKAVAAFFSNMTPTVVTDKSAIDDEQIKMGKKLAENGNWSNDVPACFTCHGVGANGIGEYFPALAGQYSTYIKNQLTAWRSGQRKNDPNQLMLGVSMRMNDAEINAVSAYLSRLPLAAQ